MIERWIHAYKKVPDETVAKIKKEVKMSFAATTISEHIHNEGKIEGKKEGKIEGNIEGEIKGQIIALEKLYNLGILKKKQFEEMTAPLREKLSVLQSSLNFEDDATVH